jgi:ABC-2 type transport system ATP-binding protein
VTSLTPTVTFDRVSKRYRSRAVLDEVSFTVGPGVTGLLGPNGAGKTTLLRIAATVLRPDGGTVRVFGRDPEDEADRHAIRSRLGFQPQEPGFFQGFTVRDFVDYVAILKEQADPTARRDEVRRVIERVDLTPHADRKIRKLSGGMRRRVAIAQALLGRPELLVLDEPTAGLDPEQRFRFREVVSEVAARHSVLLSTHQTDDVAALCDRVVVMHQGTVLFDGGPEQLTALAAGRVWVDDRAHPDAELSWRTSAGRVRQVGTPPAGSELAEPTLEDGYLLLVRDGRARCGEPA